MILKRVGIRWLELEDLSKITSTIDTRTADIIANEWPAENVGAPHCRGYGNLNLTKAKVHC